MNILVTAGNTQAPIDRVRCVTNIFTGRTGTRIALHAHGRGHAVTLLTSHPGVVAELAGGRPLAERWQVHPYRTFDDLQEAMAAALRPGGFDVVVHSAAVSDYLAAGVYHWHIGGPAFPVLLDSGAGKVKSDEPELWLRLVRAPKLIDQVRTDWGFRGVLVKFKLEVGVSEEQLLEIAERSRRHSAADLMVANTLEAASEWAYLGPLAGRYEWLARADLEARLLDVVERLHGGRGDG
jgi:phosphopantothenate-cysteine ligase/phosphopantothenoylcysteine decarboxylase/phosphopantothenate--cysteine ligase